MYRRYGPEYGGFSEFYKEYLQTHHNDASVDLQSNTGSHPVEEAKDVDEVKTKREFFFFHILKKLILNK